MPTAPLLTGTAYQKALDDEYSQDARRFAARVVSIAERLEAGEPLHGLEVALAAAVLRGWADSLPRSRPRQRGAPPCFNQDDAVSWLVLVTEFQPEPARRAQAVRELLERLPGVTEEAVHKAFRRRAPAWRTFFLGMGMSPTKPKPRAQADNPGTSSVTGQIPSQ